MSEGSELPEENEPESEYFDEISSILRKLYMNQISEDSIVNTVLEKNDPEFKKELLEYMELYMEEVTKYNMNAESREIPRETVKETLEKYKEQTRERMRKLQERLNRIIL